MRGKPKRFMPSSFVFRVYVHPHHPTQTSSHYLMKWFDEEDWEEGMNNQVSSLVCRTTAGMGCTVWCSYKQDNN